LSRPLRVIGLGAGRLKNTPTRKGNLETLVWARESKALAVLSVGNVPYVGEGKKNIMAGDVGTAQRTQGDVNRQGAQRTQGDVNRQGAQRTQGDVNRQNTQRTQGDSRRLGSQGDNKGAQGDRSRPVAQGDKKGSQGDERRRLNERLDAGKGQKQQADGVNGSRNDNREKRSLQKQQSDAKGEKPGEADRTRRIVDDFKEGVNSGKISVKFNGDTMIASANPGEKQTKWSNVVDAYAKGLNEGKIKATVIRTRTEITYRGGLARAMQGFPESRDIGRGAGSSGSLTREVIYRDGRRKDGLFKKLADAIKNVNGSSKETASKEISPSVVKRSTTETVKVGKVVR